MAKHNPFNDLTPGSGLFQSKFSDFNESAVINARTYDYYLQRLINLAVNRFKWINLPPSIDKRFIELSLLSNGSAVFFQDEVLGYLCIKVMYGAPLNVYQLPVQYRAFGDNGYQKELNINDSVIIWDNYTHTPPWNALTLFAWRLYSLRRTYDVNLNQQKFPAIIKSSDSQRLTMLNLMKKYDGNVPFIFGDKSMDTSGIEVLDLKSPYNLDKLSAEMNNAWNEALTYLGIENSKYSKQERLITDELSSSLGDVEAQRIIALNSRREACEKINTLFGLDIWVDFNTTSTAILDTEARTQIPALLMRDEASEVDE